MLAIRRTVLFLLSAVVFGATLAACGTDGGGGTGGSTPTAAIAANGGKAIFARYCNTCHPGGHRGAGPSLTERDYSAEELRTVVRKGKTRMPGYTEKLINEEQLTELVGYVQSLK